MKKSLVLIAVVIIVLPVAITWHSERALSRHGEAVHPLAPLTVTEVNTAVDLLKEEGKVSDTTRFPLIALHEPPKDRVLTRRSGADVAREVFVVLLNKGAGDVFEAVVDVTNEELVSFERIEGVQPNVLIEEFFAVEEIVKSDPEWQAAMRKRGITDFENVQVDPWSAGYFGFDDEEGRRLLRAPSYYYKDATNPYAKPIEGVLAYVDMNAGEVFKLIDTGVRPVPPNTADYTEDAVGPLREAPKPIVETRPDGVSFEVDNGEVHWQNWRFRFRVHPRVGPIISQVGYEDDGKLRSILYRASLSEMVVPYGDPDPMWFWRNAFDAGEYGLGRLASPLRPGQECPEHAVFFDAVFADDLGNPYVQPNAVCLFEHEAGVAWSHFDFIRGIHETRKSTELVLRFIATVGNYDYGFDWTFQQDGRLAVDAFATGIDQPKGVFSSHAAGAKAEEETQHGELVSQKVVAPYHQHFFNFRLDFDVDGRRNNAVELNMQPLPADEETNPWLNAVTLEETVFSTEQEAQRDLNLESYRQWSVVNPRVKNKLGHPTGYALEPHTNAVPFAHPDAWVRKRAGFLDHHFWVTPYNPEELFAAGDYPNQSPGGKGLVEWTAANRSIDDEDIVVWYTLGLNHVTRTEDWPVMPSEHLSFELVPHNFFDRNPAINLPDTQDE